MNKLQTKFTMLTTGPKIKGTDFEYTGIKFADSNVFLYYTQVIGFGRSSEDTAVGDVEPIQPGMSEFIDAIEYFEEFIGFNCNPGMPYVSTWEKYDADSIEVTMGYMAKQGDASAIALIFKL